MEKARLFTASDKMRNEYCAKIVRIGEMSPIEGSDFLVKTMMDGFCCVVPKGVFTVGEPVIYCLNETAVNKRFLAVNNQFDMSHYELNANAREVAALVADGRKAEARRMVGFFNKHGRVRMIQLRGCPSYGCIFKLDALARWKPKLADEDLESYFTVDENGYEHPFCFDTVDGVLFTQVYVPMTRGVKRYMSASHRRRTGHLFDRLVPGQFAFHYDTEQLRGNMWRLSPQTPVSISVKLHGTSVVIGNLMTRIPRRLSYIEEGRLRQIVHRIAVLEKSPARFPWQRDALRRETERLKAHVPERFRLDYGPVFSSRTVVKNQYIDDSFGPGFYNVDIWSEYGTLLFPFIPQGVAVYGEICGYLSGESKMIQDQYDYGCRPGENFLMPYRITATTANGDRREWDVGAVNEWTRRLVADHPELAPRLRPMTVLYQGALGALYPDVPQGKQWGDTVLGRIANDGERMGMERLEPLCDNPVPREGVVLRIDGDIYPEAFKLKSNLFFERECKLIDQGEMDMEMAANVT